MTPPDGQTVHLPGAGRAPQALLPRLGPTLIVSLVLASIVGFVVMAATVWRYTPDDAFITFRYAENLARGWGITWNHAPPRAEGYTSILWTLIMALPHLVGIDAVLFSKLAGVCLTLGTICVIVWGVFALQRGGTAKSGSLGAAFAAILFLTFPHAPMHAVSGMETALAAFLYALTAVSFLRAQAGAASSPLLPLSCLLLGLTRPEANLFSLALLAIVFFSLPAERRWRFARGCLAFYVLPGVGYFAWRYHYYGVLLPLPYYIKSAGVGLAGLRPTLSFAKDLVIAFAIPLSVWIATGSTRQTLILLPILLLLAYFMTVEHIMGYGHRYFFPLVPVLSLLSGLAFSARLQSRAGIRTKTAFLLFLVLACASGVAITVKSARAYLSYARGMETAHLLLGRTLAAVPWSAGPILAIGDAGAVPYYSRLETIDTFGLNDPAIATGLRGDRSGYVLSKDPTVVVLISRQEDAFDPALPHEDALYRSCVAGGFSRHVTFVFSKTYYLWAMWRPDSRDAYVLDEVLAIASRQSHAMMR